MVRLLTQDSIGSYEAFVREHPLCTPFHTREWIDLTSEVFGFKPVYLASFEDSTGAVKGVLPLFYVKTVFGSRLVSLPLRDKGGALSDRPETATALLKAAVAYGLEKKVGYIHIKTDNPEETRLLERESFVRKDEWMVSYIELDRDFEETRRRFTDKRINWSINKAKKSNLVFEASSSRDDIVSFYSIFVKNRKRLGVPPYSIKLFFGIYDRFIRKGRAKLFFVSRDGVRLTGIIVFLSHDRAYDVYSASLTEAFDFRANDCQMYCTIKWLCENGYREYDLGADSRHQENLLTYKRKWGARVKPLAFYYYLNRTRDIPIRDSDHSRYRFLRKVWSKTPDFLFQNLGSYLIKYLA